MRRRLLIFVTSLLAVPATARASQPIADDLCSTTTADAPRPTSRTFTPHEMATAAIRELFVLRLDEPSLDAVYEAVTLSDAQRLHADRGFDAYEARLEAVHAELIETLLPIAFELMRLSPEQRRTPTPRLAELSSSVETALRRAKPEMIDGLSTFNAHVHSVLTDTQRAQWHTAMQGWRRLTMLNSGRRAGRTTRDLDQHVDLITLAETLCTIRPPARVCVHRTAYRTCEMNHTWDLHAQLDAWAITYREGLDSMLQSQFWANWGDSLRARTAALNGDDDVVDRHRRTAIRRWMRVYRFNVESAAQLTGLLRDAGDPAGAHRWQSAFDAAYFPHTHADKTADFAHRWLVARGSVTGEQHASIAQMYRDHGGAREALRARRRSALIHVVEEEQIMPALVGFYHATGGLDALRLIDQQRRALNDRTIDAFESVLYEDQRHAFRAAIMRFTIDGVRGETVEF